MALSLADIYILASFFLFPYILHPKLFSTAVVAWNLKQYRFQRQCLSLVYISVHISHPITITIRLVVWRTNFDIILKLKTQFQYHIHRHLICLYITKKKKKTTLAQAQVKSDEAKCDKYRGPIYFQNSSNLHLHTNLWYFFQCSVISFTMHG